MNDENEKEVAHYGVCLICRLDRMVLVCAKMCGNDLGRRNRSTLLFKVSVHSAKLPAELTPYRMCRSADSRFLEVMIFGV